MRSAPVKPWEQQNIDTSNDTSTTASLTGPIAHSNIQLSKPADEVDSSSLITSATANVANAASAVSPQAVGTNALQTTDPYRPWGGFGAQNYGFGNNYYNSYNNSYGYGGGYGSGYGTGMYGGYGGIGSSYGGLGGYGCGYGYNRYGTYGGYGSYGMGGQFPPNNASWVTRAADSLGRLSQILDMNSNFLDQVCDHCVGIYSRVTYLTMHLSNLPAAMRGLVVDGCAAVKHSLNELDSIMDEKSQRHLHQEEIAAERKRLIRRLRLIASLSVIFILWFVWRRRRPFKRRSLNLLAPKSYWLSML